MQNPTELKPVLMKAIISLFKDLNTMKKVLAVNNLNELALQRESVQKLIDLRKVIKK